MDIQGSEGWALEGMKALIKGSKTIQILTEYEPQRLDQSGYGGVNFLLQLEELGFELMILGAVLALIYFQINTSIKRNYSTKFPYITLREDLPLIF